MKGIFKKFGLLAMTIWMVFFLSRCQSTQTPDFQLTTQEMLEVILQADFAIPPEEAQTIFKGTAPNYQVVDVRSPADYVKGHLQGAINIPTPNILEEPYLSDFQNQEVTYLLYGGDELEANGPWMVLRQMGLENIRLLQGGYQYIESANDSTAQRLSYEAEAARFDFNAVYQEALEDHQKEIEAGKIKLPPPPPPKKIVPKKKKVVVEEEEGC